MCQVSLDLDLSVVDSLTLNSTVRIASSASADSIDSVLDSDNAHQTFKKGDAELWLEGVRIK